MTPEKIKQARLNASYLVNGNREDMPRKEAARLAGVHKTTWKAYEIGARNMPECVWNAFLLATDQHPTLKLVAK